MEKELLDYTAMKVEELLAAPSSSKVTLDAAKAWKESVAAGADVDAATTELLDAIDRHHTTIDELIAFTEGRAKDLLGEEVAAGMHAHALEIQAQGAKYCDCAACTAAHALLAKHGRPVQ
jgi:hypothetical protein